MKGKRYSKETTRNISSISKIIIAIIIVFIFALIMLFSGIKVFNWAKENEQTQEVLENISNFISIAKTTDGIDKYSVNFNKLKETNSDIIAWLKVNGTDIEYPVVKTINNDYYMTHSFDKTYNRAGWVFMDYKNRFDNMVIYAHNRRDGSMFGTLKNILTEEWQNKEENFVIKFITENEIAEYQVFSVYRTKNEEYYITTNFETDNEFKKFIDTIK